MDFKVQSEDEIMCNKHFFYNQQPREEHVSLKSIFLSERSNLLFYKSCMVLLHFSVIKEGKYLSVHSALGLTLCAYPVLLFLRVVGCSVSLQLEWMIQSSRKPQFLLFCF